MPLKDLYKKKMKDWLMQFLVFSRKERLGLAVLLFLIGCVWLLPEFFGSFKKPDKEILEKADSARIALTGKNANGELGSLKIFPLFPFDPNTLDEEGWKKLGIRPKTIGIIKNYLSKGGRFREPSDLAKIYSLRPDESARLIPYVTIKNIHYSIDWPERNNSIYDDRGYSRKKKKPNEIPPYKGDYSTPYKSARSIPWENKNRDNHYRVRRETPDIDINTADTSLFIALPGIGNRLAARIIIFREKLGGFHKVEQLSEVYGLQDSVFRLIRPFLLLRDSGLRKIQINSAGFESLNEHPYIQFAEARAIVQYRKQHGSFNNFSDLMKINILTHEWIEKIGPYLAFDLSVVQKE
jgi:competence ComEA-like helix-hairpin-helix protein